MPDELMLPDLNLPDKKSASMSAFEQVAGENPDQVAQVSSIAAKTGKPAPFVAAHLEQAKQATAYSPDFWAKLDKQYPGTSKWVSKPENMAVSHDDLENLKGQEQIVQDYTFAQELWKAAKKGTASMASGALRVPSFAYELALTPGNLLAKAVGGKETHIPESWINTPEAKYWDEVVAANTTPANRADIVKMAGRGDISGAAKSLALQVVASAPNQALIIPATIAGAGVPALFGMGAIAAGNAMKEGVDSGADRTAATLNAGAQGIFEGATERFGTFGILKHWETALGKELGQKTVKEVIKATAKVMAYSGLGEGTEEGVNTGLGATAAYASGVNPAAYEGLAGQMANSFVVGAGSGFAMTGPGALLNGRAHMVEVRQAEATKKVYLAMGAGLEASKLRARLPEAQRNFVEAVTKGGPVENIYVDREAAEVYFQSKGIDPDQAFTQMGATAESLTESKEAGGRIKIATADWAANVVGTEHFAGLADDVAFEPNAPTIRKVNEIRANSEKEFKALDEKIKTDEATKTDYDKAHGLLKADQMKLGVNEKQADAFAQVMAKRALYLAKAEGKTVDEIMGDRPTAATPEDYKYGFDKSGKPLVELTPEEIQQVDLENHMEVMRDMGGVSPIKDAVREFGGIDYAKVKRDSMGSNMPEPTLGGGIYRKGGKSVSEMAGALMRAGKVPEGWDEIELADAINKETAEEAKFKTKYGEAKYQKLRKDKLYQAAVKKAGEALDPVLFQSAWHGSPHDFDKFSLHAIGTGEGAQAYGYGLYFAGDKAVAEYYKKTLSSPKITVDGKEVSGGMSNNDYAAAKLVLGNKDIDQLIRQIKAGNIAPLFMVSYVEKLRGKSVEQKDSGKLYEVNIPESDKMLDWDKAWGEQPLAVKEALSKSGITKEADDAKAAYLATLTGEAKAIAEKLLAAPKSELTDGSHDADWKALSKLAPNVDHNAIHDIQNWHGRHQIGNGEEFYREIVQDKGSPEAASKFLHSLGIVGIRYVDGNSRGGSGYLMPSAIHETDGERNYKVRHYAVMGPNNSEFAFKTMEEAREFYDKKVAEFEKSKAHNYVIFDDNAVEILNKYYQAAQDNSENARGFYDVVNNLLVRGDKADASTYWHEFSHYYLDRLFKASKSGKANEEFGKDWATMSKWLGITADQTALTVEQHEQFARGSEAYLRGDDYSIEGKAGRFSVMSAMSGKSIRDFKTKGEAEKWIKKNTIKAPSKELKAVFARFRVWLTKVYKSVKELNVVVPDDVRQVFDRMVMGEDAVTRAEVDLGLDKITEGLPEMDAVKLRAIHKEAHDEAVHLMIRHLLVGVTKESKAERDALAAKVEKEATKSLLTTRPYKAQGMTTREEAQAYIDGKLSPKDGMKFSLNAEMLGYTSGDEMAKEVLVTKPLNEVVAAQVKAIVDAHKEIDSPEALRVKAEELVHSEKRMELMALERRLAHNKIFSKDIPEAMLERWAQEASVEAAMSRRTAGEILAGKEVIEAAKFSNYATMERNAAAKVAAAMAVKDWVKVVVYKKHQMVCHAMYSKSLEISRLLEKKMNRVDKIHKKPMEQFKDQDSFDQVGLLFMRFGFGNLKRFAPTPKTMMLPDYVKKINSIFSDPLNPEASTDYLDIPDWIASGPNKSWRDMTWEEFQEFDNTLSAILKVANMMDKGFTITRNATLSATAAEMGAAALANNRQGRAPHVVDTKLDRAVALSNDYLYSLDGVDALTQKLDGYKDGGVWQAILLDQQRECSNAEDRQMRQFRDAMKAAWAASFTEKEAKDLFTKETFYEEMGASMPKSTLICMYLNMGALENREKLFANPIVGTNPDVWNEAFLTEFIGKNLTRKECEFAERARDIINDLWPDVAKLNEEMTGFAPAKIEAVPYSLQLADGTVFQSKGGYFPLKSDRRANTKFGEKTAEREIADSPLYTEQNSAARAMTKTGHTKKRTRANYTLQMDLSIIDRHLRDVIHDIHFRGLVFDLRRILANEGVMMAVKSTLGAEAFTALKLHVNSYATGAQAEKLSSDGVSRVMRWIGNRVSVAFIVGKVAVITQNLANMCLAGNAIEGFTHWDTAKAILFRGIGKYWRPGAFHQLERNKMLQEVWGLSEFMRSKRMTPDYTLSDIKEGNLTEQQTTKEFFLGLMAGTDDLTNVPVWMEAYAKRIKAGDASEVAVKYADRLISRISGSGRKYDQALLVKGSDMQKLFAKFYTFWNLEYANWLRNMNQSQRLMVEGKIGKGSAKFMGFVASRLVFVWISGLLVGGAPGDDEDKKKAWWWKQYLTYPLAFFPVIRDIAASPINEMVGLPSYGYRSAPVFSMLESVGRTGQAAVKFTQGEIEFMNLMETSSKTAAFIAPYPDQFNSWFWNAYDAMYNDMEVRPQDFMVRRPKKDR